MYIMVPAHAVLMLSVSPSQPTSKTMSHTQFRTTTTTPPCATCRRRLLPSRRCTPPSAVRCAGPCRADRTDGAVATSFPANKLSSNHNLRSMPVATRNRGIGLMRYQKTRTFFVGVCVCYLFVIVCPGEQCAK